jgi:hypothetical protein
MLKNSVALAAFSIVLGACSSLPHSAAHPLIANPAPVSFDGNVSGKATEYVFVLVTDSDPAIPGLAMRRGDSLRLQLPADFRRNDQVAVSNDTDANLVLTKGWPQAALKLKDRYRVDYDASINGLTVTAMEDIGPGSGDAPGIKAIHVRGRTFVNPAAGDYPAEVRQVAADGSIVATWTGSIKVIASAPHARVAPSNFHLPPGSDSDFQKAALGRLMPQRIGVLLWDEAGRPMNGVGIAPRDLQRYPRYTGGLLVQDSNGDGVLDPAVDKVVGGDIGAAPDGAKGQSAVSPKGNDGKLILSGNALRNAAYAAAAGGGKPNPGLLVVEFRAGDKAGFYRPTFELIDGNSVQFALEALP